MTVLSFCLFFNKSEKLKLNALLRNTVHFHGNQFRLSTVCDMLPRKKIAPKFSVISHFGFLNGIVILSDIL